MHIHEVCSWVRFKYHSCQKNKWTLQDQMQTNQDYGLKTKGLYRVITNGLMPWYRHLVVRCKFRRPATTLNPFKALASVKPALTPGFREYYWYLLIIESWSVLLWQYWGVHILKPHGDTHSTCLKFYILMRQGFDWQGSTAEFTAEILPFNLFRNKPCTAATS